MYVFQVISKKKIANNILFATGDNSYLKVIATAIYVLLVSSFRLVLAFPC